VVAGSIPHPDTVFCYFSLFNRRAWPFNGPARHDYQAAVPCLGRGCGTWADRARPDYPSCLTGPYRAGPPVWASISIPFSPDSKWLVVPSSVKGTIHVFSVNVMRRRRRRHRRRATALIVPMQSQH
jgi:hypothetical protein